MCWQSESWSRRQSKQQNTRRKTGTCTFSCERLLRPRCYSHSIHSGLLKRMLAGEDQNVSLIVIVRFSNVHNRCSGACSPIESVCLKSERLSSSDCTATTIGGCGAALYKDAYSEVDEDIWHRCFIILILSPSSCCLVSCL